MSLRSILEDAESQIDLYKNPSIEEAEKLLEEILVAADLGSIAHERIVSFTITSNEVRVVTSWSARNCDQSSDYSFPTTIIDADNHIKAASIWGIEQKIRIATKHKDEAARTYQYYSDKLNEAYRQLAKAKE